jgi:hypothetical protein
MRKNATIEVETLENTGFVKNHFLILMISTYPSLGKNISHKYVESITQFEIEQYFTFTLSLFVKFETM